jgi:hypothetical protein
MRNSFPEVLHKIIGLGRRVEGNPDIKEIIMKIETKAGYHLCLESMFAM